MNKCSQCGAVAAASQRFCGECGARLVAPPSGERNAVMHRPGGGVPDPFTVGGSDDAVSEDFFSQFVPKSSIDSGDAPQSPQPPTRRARRRFNPSLYDTGEVPTTLPKLDGEPAPQQPSAAEQAAPPAAPEPPVSAQPEPQSQAQAEPERVNRPQPQASEPAVPATPPQAFEPTAPAPEQQPAAGEPEPPSAPVQVPPSFLDDEPENQPDAEPSASDTNTVERPAGAADESTFTSLIVGLDNDPADRPISSPAFNETGIVPLPQQAPAPVDPEVTAARERAAAFWSGNGGGQPADPAQYDDPARHSHPGQQGTPAQHEATVDEPDHEDDQFTNIDALFAEPEPVERFADDGDEQPVADDPDATRRHEPVVVAQSSPFAPPAAAAGGSEMPPLPGLPGRSELADDHRQQDAQRDSAAVPPMPAAAGAGASAGAFGGGGGFAGGGNGGAADGVEQEQQRRGVRLILVAAAAALLVIGGVFGVTRLFGGGDDGGEAAATTSASEAPATVTAPNLPERETESPAPPTEEQPQFEPVAFQSESGNIRCQITPENGVACQMLSPAFAPDENQCDGAFSGAAVGITKDGVNYPCLEGDLAGGQVLGYNEPISAGEFGCVIDYELGLSCNNKAVDAFTMEYYAGISSSGNAAADKNPTVPVYVP